MMLFFAFNHRHEKLFFQFLLYGISRRASNSTYDDDLVTFRVQLPTLIKNFFSRLVPYHLLAIYWEFWSSNWIMMLQLRLLFKDATSSHHTITACISHHKGLNHLLIYQSSSNCARIHIPMFTDGTCSAPDPEACACYYRALREFRSQLHFARPCKRAPAPA